MLVVFEPGLDVVTAVSGGLEAVNPDDLLSRQTRCKRHFGIGALEFGLALRKPRDELEFLERRRDKVGDHRHIDPRRRNFGLKRIPRLRRAGVCRRPPEPTIANLHPLPPPPPPPTKF